MISFVLCAQQGENPLPYIDKPRVFDTAPRFPGGSDAMMKYFEDSIRFIENGKRHKAGVVMSVFTVTEKGKISKIRIVNGVPGEPEYVKEAIRVLESMPMWMPATLKGKAVEAEYDLSIPFKFKSVRKHLIHNND